MDIAAGCCTFRVAKWDSYEIIGWNHQNGPTNTKITNFVVLFVIQRYPKFCFLNLSCFFFGMHQMRSGEHIFEHPDLNDNLLPSYLWQKCQVEITQCWCVLTVWLLHLVTMVLDSVRFPTYQRPVWRYKMLLKLILGQTVAKHWILGCRSQTFRRTQSHPYFDWHDCMICYECCVGLCRTDLSKPEFDNTPTHVCMIKIPGIEENSKKKCYSGWWMIL